MATKKRAAKRGGTASPGRRETVLVVGMDLNSGAISQLEVSAEVGMRYIDMHSVVPENIDRWTPEEIRRVARQLNALASCRRWEVALILLAHHRSRLARDLLLDLEPRVPAAVREFYEIALGESQSWLGDPGDSSGEVPLPGTFVFGSSQPN